MPLGRAARENRPTLSHTGSAHTQEREHSTGRYTYHLIRPVRFHLGCLQGTFTLPSLKVFGITVERVASDGVDDLFQICSTLALQGLKSAVG